jgi:hypothetical protein
MSFTNPVQLIGENTNTASIRGASIIRHHQSTDGARGIQSISNKGNIET